MDWKEPCSELGFFDLHYGKAAIVLFGLIGWLFVTTLQKGTI